MEPQPAVQSTQRSADQRFAKRVAVVTGAGQGIGQAVAAVLAGDGASVVLADVSAPALEQAVEQVRATGGEVHPALADVTQASDVKRLIETTRAHFGPPDILVNSAGVLRSTAVSDIAESEWDLVLDVNLKGTFLCCQAVLTSMRQRRYGKIVNLASMAGRATSTLGGAHYTAAKAGVLGLTRHLAREAAPFNVNVNAVSPGIVDTPMVRAAFTPDKAAAVIASIPFGRMAAADEVARLIAFLVSDDAAYITGASVDIHGGELIIA